MRHPAGIVVDEHRLYVVSQRDHSDAGSHSELLEFQSKTAWVLVDGEVKSVVKAGDKALKAIAHGYDFATVHRISVRTVGAKSKSSPEAGCTMVVGKDAPLGPTNLRATRIRTTSAAISWMPSNTNFQIGRASCRERV